MRNFLTLCLVVLGTVAYSQKEIAWFDAGLKVMYGTSHVINSVAFDDKNLDYKIKFGNSFSFGGKFGVNRGYNGLALELLYSKADGQYELLDSPNASPEINWNSLDLYILFRNAANLGFFEIGPKIGFLRGVNRTVGLDADPVAFEDYNGRQISGVLSFGANVIGTDGGFSGQLGLRFEYGFTDLNSLDSPTAEPFAFQPNLLTTEYARSSPVFVGLVFELNFGLGYYGIAQCGARAKFFNI